MIDGIKNLWLAEPVRILYALVGAAWVGYSLWNGSLSFDDVVAMSGLVAAGETARASVYAPDTVAALMTKRATPADGVG